MPTSEQGAASLQDLARELRRFAEERDWVKFHSPKNLVMALAGETGELVEIFQWLPTDECGRQELGRRLGDVEGEMADVFIYLLRLADVLGVDLLNAAHTKLALNRERYPVDLVRGRAVKYSHLEEQ